MKNNLILIDNDCYFIAQRLKEIDESYFIVFNLFKRVYEVHSKNQQKNSYCFTIPYLTLDDRTIDFAIKTRKENIDKILKEIDENNNKVYKKNIKEQVEKIKEAICW